MDETRKTLAFVAAAALVTIVAFLAAPGDPTPEAFSDRGEVFFPDFSDPNDAASLEVIDFDEETGRIDAFNVVFKGTRWRIPSHHNYAADDKDRLARTAAGLIEVRKDDVVAEVAADHESLGVVDPLDESVASLAGRGKRVTVKDGNENLLADLIIGKNVPGREGRFRYLRVPGQKRTYAARFDVDVSSRFGDWIEKDLLELDLDRIEQVTLKDYSIDESTRILDQRDTIVLTRGDPDWTANRMRSGQKVDGVKMEDLLKALDELTIVGVRPKPAGLSRSLEDNDEGISLNREGLVSLQEKGYYFTRDGQLVSNEGEAQVRSKDGVVYTLRFGEIVYGAGEAVTARDGDVGGTADRTDRADRVKTGTCSSPQIRRRCFSGAAKTRRYGFSGPGGFAVDDRRPDQSRPARKTRRLEKERRDRAQDHRGPEHPFRPVVLRNLRGQLRSDPSAPRRPGHLPLSAEAAGFTGSITGTPACSFPYPDRKKRFYEPPTRMSDWPKTTPARRSWRAPCMTPASASPSAIPAARCWN